MTELRTPTAEVIYSQFAIAADAQQMLSNTSVHYTQMVAPDKPQPGWALVATIGDRLRLILTVDSFHLRPAAIQVRRLVNPRQHNFVAHLSGDRAGWIPHRSEQWFELTDIWSDTTSRTLVELGLYGQSTIGYRYIPPMGPQQVISLSLLQHQGDTIVEVGKASGGTDPIARAVNAVTPLGGPDFFQAFGITQARPYDLECQQLLQAHLVDIQREHNQALASIGLQVGQAIDLSGYIRRQAQRR